MGKYLAEIMTQQLQCGPALFRIMLQTVIEELLALGRQINWHIRRFAHTHFEHNLKVGIELGPRTLR